MGVDSAVSSRAVQKSASKIKMAAVHTGPAADSEAEMIVLSEDNYKDLIGKQIKVIAVASSENELEIEKEKEVNVKIIAAADKTDEEQVAASAPPEKVDSNQQSTVGYFLSK